VIIRTASEALPVTPNSTPRRIIPMDFQYKEPFSSDKAISSSMSVFSVSLFLHLKCVPNSGSQRIHQGCNGVPPDLYSL
jgi:hypothetical protein